MSSSSQHCPWPIHLLFFVFLITWQISDGSSPSWPGLTDALHVHLTLVLQSYFPSYLDHHLQLPAYWADWELHINEDAKAARTVWEDTVKGPAGVQRLIIGQPAGSHVSSGLQAGGCCDAC